MSDNITKRVGLGTAYGFAKAGGYEGTVAEFTELLGNIAIDLARIENLSVAVTTLPAGSQATASLNGSVLSLGIPKGDKGDKGDTGETGAPAGFGTVSATVDSSVGTPSVEVTASGADTAKNFAFAFHNLKGQKGDKGDTGEVSEAELAEALEDFAENGTVANAEQLTTKIRANDQTPYLFRTSGGSVDIGDREYINGIVGGTVAWNQLFNKASSVATASPSVASISKDSTTGIITWTISDAIQSTSWYQNSSHAFQYHKVFCSQKVSANKACTYAVRMENAGPSYVDIPANVETLVATIKALSNYSGTAALGGHISGYEANTVVTISDVQFIDLTQVFGSAIADYIYSLETANAGAGVAWFRKLFPKDYYAYNAGELMSVRGLVSHDMVGFNAFDVSTGKAKVVGGCQYEIVGTYTSLSLDGEAITPSSGKFTPSKDGELTVVGGNSTTCVHLVWDGSEDGNYEPYQKWSYPLDSDLELRGIPKLDNGNLYYDGDVYESDGTVTRRFNTVTFDGSSDEGWVLYSGYRFYPNGINLSDFTSPANAVVANIFTDRGFTVCAKSALPNDASGAYSISAFDSGGRKFMINVGSTELSDVVAYLSAHPLTVIYEKATPTTESADPFTSPQIVNDFGTEEFVIDDTIDVPIPVGHNTDYPVDLKAKVEMAPNSPDGDGDYIVRQTNGTNEYVALANNATIQNILSRLEALEG